MIRPPAAAIILVVLAGCVGGSASNPDDAAPAGAPVAAPEVSTAKGAIDGRVLASDLLPVAGADVGLLPLTGPDPPFANTTTGEDGRFVFSLIEPGSYRLHAAKIGYGDAAAFIEVAPETIATATLRLDEIESNEPRIDVFTKNGIQRCAWAAVVYSDSCGVSQVMGPTQLTFQYNITEGSTTTLLETTWPYPDTTMDNWVYARVNASDPWGFMGGAIGPPVLRKVFRPNEQGSGTQATLNHKPFPGSEEPFFLRVQTFYDGKFQREANQTAFEACKLTLGYCAGVGVALDFKFNQYVSVFVWAPPTALDKYSALPDA